MANPAFGTDKSPAVQFSSDNQPENNGRKPGIKNRSTIIKQIFTMVGVLPDEMYNALKEVIPSIEQQMTLEEILSIAQIAQGMKGDTSAYKAVMDSAYGAPKQEVAMKGNLELNKKVTFK